MDLLLLHRPNQTVSLAEQIGTLNEVAKSGKARHIGVSNFNIALMKEAVRLSAAPLVTNQVEYHPCLDQSAMIGAAATLGLTVRSSYAMADGKVLSDPYRKQIAVEKRKSVPQVVLRWIVQQGLVALSKTVSEGRAPENAEPSPVEMQAIRGLANPTGRRVKAGGLASAWDLAP